jgi:hypothetical protein
MFDEIAEISLELARYAMNKDDRSGAEQYATAALNAKHPVSFNIVCKIRNHETNLYIVS